jgi:flavin-dependent dehydrogenase
MKVESICIVGGGSSGWMSAALLSKSFSNIEICLIESEVSKPIGVGESTLGHFNRFLKRLGLDDDTWMPKCNATYKTSIAFKNFREGNGERFQYPFGGWDFNDHYKKDLLTFFQLQSEYGEEAYPPEEFARFYNMNTYLADECKIADDIPNSNYNPKTDTAYHLDADLFGKFLRDTIAIPNGVVHLKGDVQNVVKRPDGSIESIMTTEGGIVTADLFLDCTGFKSLLLEQHMGSEFSSFKNQLFNDRALATQIPYTDRINQMETYTDCVAMDAGWVWNIPLWHRVGTGYVYSSKYISDDDAEKEFREYLSERYSPEIAESANLRPIKIKHGKRKKAWVKNVIGIGLSYGFLEPLESTGLMTTHENLIFLCDVLNRREGFVSKVDRDSFNYIVDNALEVMKNFISMHYFLSKRKDTQYWIDVVETVEIDPEYSKVQSTYQATSGYFNLLSSPDYIFQTADLTGVTYIMAGLGYRPLGDFSIKEKYANVDKSEIEEAHTLYQQDRQVMLDWVRKLPSHYEYLRDNIYGSDEYV